MKQDMKSKTVPGLIAPAQFVFNFHAVKMVVILENITSMDVIKK